MNPVQISSTAAPIIAFFAGLLAGKGVFGLDTATWTTVIGGLVTAGATIWAAVWSRKSSIVTTVAQLPEVDSIQLNRSASENLQANTPRNVSTDPA